MRVTKPGEGQDSDDGVRALRKRVSDLAALNRKLEKKVSDLSLKHDAIIHNLDHAPAGFFTLTTDGTIESVNLTGALMLGREPKRMVHSAFRTTVYPADCERWDDFFQTLKERKEPGPIEIRIARKRGGFFPGLIRGSRSSVQGHQSQVHLVISDITRYQDELERLRQSEERFRDLITTTADIVWETDENARFTYISPQIEDILGYRQEDVIGRVVFDFLAPDSVEENRKAFREAIAENRRIMSHDSHWIHRNGTISILESRAIPKTRPDGRLSGFRGIDRDITQRKRVEQALMESEERFRILLQDIPSVAVQGYLMDGTTHYWNRASEILYGYSQEEAIGKNLVDLIIPPEMKDDVRQAIAFMSSTGQSIPASELLLMRKDGSRVPVFSSHGLITRRDGTRELFCIDIDLTGQKQATQALDETNQKLRFLTGLTRHDIFNQLAAVQRFHSLAIEEQDLATKNRYITYATQAADRIESIIGFTRDYETFGTVSSGWQKVAGIIDSAQMEVPLGGVLVENKIPPDLEIYADPLIRKVFTSLMENAVRHGGTVRKIRFSAKESATTLKIICEDDGAGVVKEEKECIFDHGYGKHTGIGLFLSREVLSITGLSITENGRPGKGARFEIVVPEGRFRQPDS